MKFGWCPPIIQFSVFEKSFCSCCPSSCVYSGNWHSWQLTKSQQFFPIHQARAIVSPGRCGNCPARWSPMTFRYSQPCVALSHTVSGLVCFTNRISLPKLGYKTNCGSCLLRSLVSLEGAWCHVMRKPKQLMERLKWQRTEASWHSHESEPLWKLALLISWMHEDPELESPKFLT